MTSRTAGPDAGAKSSQRTPSAVASPAARLCGSARISPSHPAPAAPAPRLGRCRAPWPPVWAGPAPGARPQRVLLARVVGYRPPGLDLLGEPLARRHAIGSPRLAGHAAIELSGGAEAQPHAARSQCRPGQTQLHAVER